VKLFDYSPRPRSPGYSPARSMSSWARRLPLGQLRINPFNAAARRACHNDQGSAADFDTFSGVKQGFNSVPETGALEWSLKMSLHPFEKDSLLIWVKFCSH
jgi:hypothetical protein